MCSKILLPSTVRAFLFASFDSCCFFFFQIRGIIKTHHGVASGRFLALGGDDGPVLERRVGR